jgi:hypothetical protein
VAKRWGPATTGDLSDADLALAVFGPWDPRAAVEMAERGPLWHPRCAADRLEAMLERHRAAIVATAAAAGVAEPWIVSRVAFTRELQR